MLRENKRTERETVNYPRSKIVFQRTRPRNDGTLSDKQGDTNRYSRGSHIRGGW